MTTPVVYSDYRGNVAKEEWNDAWSDAELKYLKLDSSNDPITGPLQITADLPTNYAQFAVDGNDGSGAILARGKTGGRLYLDDDDSTIQRVYAVISFANYMCLCRTNNNYSPTNFDMVMDTNGNIGMGIGLSAPSEQLEVTGNIHLSTDSDKMLFGAAKDASISYDGTDLIIKSDEIGSGAINLSGGIIGKVMTVTDTYTILSNDATVICNKATAFTVTLPTAVAGQIYTIKNIGAGTVTVDGAGADTIDGETTQDVIQWESLKIQCYAANSWAIV